MNADYIVTRYVEIVETRVQIKFTAFRLSYLLAAWNNSFVHISFNDVEYRSQVVIAPGHRGGILSLFSLFLSHLPVFMNISVSHCLLDSYVKKQTCHLLGLQFTRST